MSCVIRVTEQLVQGSAPEEAADPRRRVELAWLAAGAVSEQGRGRGRAPREAAGEGGGGSQGTRSRADESQGPISWWHLPF